MVLTLFLCISAAIAEEVWWPDKGWITGIIVGVLLSIWFITSLIGLYAKDDSSEQSEKKQIDDKWDEFDWWQDNQGL